MLVNCAGSAPLAPIDRSDEDIIEEAFLHNAFAPAFLIGLVFVPDGLRDLMVRALDRRRVQVQRIER